MEEEAIKDNTQQVQAQVPVPVATYLLNEKRRSVFHIEKHHSVNILIIPNPNMVTPQYEVIRVRKDESIEEASYDVAVKQAAPEEAVMPKFDKEASKRDAPILQGMSSPKQAPKQPVATPQVKTETVETKSLFSGVVTWIKSLFATEEEVKPVAPKAPESNTAKSGERRPQRSRQGQRRNNRNDSRNDSRNENRTDSRNGSRNDKRKPQEVANEVKDNKQTKPAKPQKERVQKPKEEKVAERRQRRNNRKKVRLNSDENVVANTAEKAPKSENTAVERSIKENVSVVENTTVESNVVDNSSTEQAAKTKDEQRPRSRRSPRHMRAHGQRRRQNADATEANTEITEDPVTARYPEKNVVESQDTATETQAPVEASIPAPSVEKVEAAETIVATEAVNEVQQNLPFDEPEATKSVSTEANIAEVVVSEALPLEPIVSVAVETKVADIVVEAKVEPEAKVVEKAPEQPVQEQQTETVQVIESNLEAATTETSNEAPKVETEKSIEPPKKVRAKEKNIKRKVKASAKKAPGKASAPMAKPETVISSGVIPKEFVASEQRVAHSKSDKLASMAHATSRHSAGATKPSMD
jgi:ribonuclease E